MQTVSIPSSVIDRLKVIINKFLWQGNNISGTRWCNWDKACGSFAEGGLNVRKFEDLQTTFLMKAWFWFREGNSIWARFMNEKYCKNAHPSTVREKQSDSAMWKEMLRNRESTEENISWGIRGGEINLWFDRWLPSRKLARDDLAEQQKSQTVASLWDPIDRAWKGTEIESLPHASEIRATLQHLQIEDHRQDKIFWMKGTNGLFSTRSAWETINNITEAS